MKSAEAFELAAVVRLPRVRLAMGEAGGAGGGDAEVRTAEVGIPLHRRFSPIKLFGEGVLVRCVVTAKEFGDKIDPDSLISLAPALGADGLFEFRLA